MQSIVIKGNLTRDPELKSIPRGDGTVDVVNFSIAESRKFTKSNGEKAEETTFFDCEAWDSGARLIDQLMSKGDPILVTGSFKQDNWEKDGQKHSRLRLRVQNFDKLFRKSNGGGETQETSTPVSEPVAAATGEDIPF
jgi:single-strand DNA-binding protein